MSASPAAQAPARSIGGLLDTLDRVRGIHETAISPDGRRVAWVEDVSAAEATTAIYLANDRRGVDGIASRDSGRPTAAAHVRKACAWSADGHTMAFLVRRCRRRPAPGST